MNVDDERERLADAFAAGMRARRLEVGLTQAEVAAAIGRNVHTITNMEAGRRRPVLGDAILIARLLESSVDELIADS